MKAPDNEEDKDHPGYGWSEEDLKSMYHRKELRDFMGQEPDMGILKLKGITDPKDPAGMAPGSFDADALFDLDLDVIQTTSRDLFQKLREGSTATAEATRDSTCVDGSTPSSDKPSESVETERPDGEDEEADQVDEKGQRAKEQAKNATDKGLKASAWDSLVAQRNASDGRKLERDQYKSKVYRLMHIYDLYRSIINLSGVGIEDKKPTLDDDVWEELIKSKPNGKSLLMKIREFGFPHATVSSLIALGSDESDVDGESNTSGNNVAPSSIEQTKTSEDSNMDDMMRTLKLYIKMKIIDLKVRRSSADSDTHHPEQQLGDGELESHRIRSTGGEQEETKEGYDSAFFSDGDKGKQADGGK
ncbi:hypothetical protein PHMEG_00015389 [Phytophthora megakarya]|uniref:Uncharacterized protein n=1 Tax=Phytophthora megakarya TaxID=4795 RepID=A0A225W2Z3_9STRA|nr:hypothetical protein PHMEG_00015389 [Phytophthora megakarya]